MEGTTSGVVEGYTGVVPVFVEEVQGNTVVGSLVGWGRGSGEENRDSE